MRRRGARAHGASLRPYRRVERTFLPVRRRREPRDARQAGRRAVLGMHRGNVHVQVLGLEDCDRSEQHPHSIAHT